MTACAASGVEGTNKRTWVTGGVRQNTTSEREQSGKSGSFHAVIVRLVPSVSPLGQHTLSSWGVLVPVVALSGPTLSRVGFSVTVLSLEARVRFNVADLFPARPLGLHPLSRAGVNVHSLERGYTSMCRMRPFLYVCHSSGPSRWAPAPSPGPAPSTRAPLQRVLRLSTPPHCWPSPAGPRRPCPA